MRFITLNLYGIHPADSEPEFLERMFSTEDV
jgi:hypothetical protein